MGKITSPTYVECDRIEDVYYVMAECARVEAESSQLFVQFPAFERNNVGIYNNVLSSPILA